MLLQANQLEKLLELTVRLKTVEFYQSVRLWSNQETKTVKESDGIEINLEDHLVMLSMEGQEETIVIPTANMRHGRIVSLPTLIVLTDAKITQLVEAGEVKFIPVKKCEGGCTYSRSMNQPIPRICKKCNLPEEVK